MSDKEIVKEVIDAFFKEAGLQNGWSGTVNEKVAEVFGKMLEASLTCSANLDWVPRPTGGKATVQWVVKNLGRTFVRKIKGKRYFICAQRVFYNWKTELDFASMGV